MSYDLPGEINPFEAPRAGIGEEVLYRDLADNDAEMIRLENIGHEANIKSLGHLNYLGAIFWGFFVVIAALMATGTIPQPPNQPNPVDPAMQRIIMGLGALFYLVLTVINAVLGYGLTHLQVWARWTTLVFTVIAILYMAMTTLVVSFLVNPAAGVAILVIGGSILGFILHLLVTRKSGVVFSAEYKEIIRKTPHVKYKTSVIVKVFLVMFLAASLLVMAVLFSGGMR
jgi:hypothetical protein